MSAPSVRRALSAAALVALIATACSGEVSVGGSAAAPSEEAVDLIEGSLAEEAGLGPLTAECEDTSDIEPGEVFTCTGTTEDGDVVEFVGEVSEDGGGSVNSTNLATPGDIPDLADEAARILQEQNDLEVLPAMTCDDSRGLILESGSSLDCDVTNPVSGEQVSAVVTIIDGENLTISVEVVE